ncbi:MAG: cytochrome c [Acidobacteriota bacterium]|nr:cytochrome c [Acidobacteriota bacterium]
MRLLTLGVFCAAAASAATNPPQVTFSKDVLPVLQKNCQTCHRPGEAAPFSMLTYKETRPWAASMKEAVLSKKMPPWFADPHYGQFANDPSLSKAEIDTLVAWAETGAKEGNPRDAPKALAFEDGWRIGKPEWVIEMPVAFDVPAAGTVDYQYFLVPTGFKEDKYVRLAEARPGNRQLVHHIIAFIREPGNPWMKDLKPGVPFVPKQDHSRGEDGGGGFGGEFLVGYAPGTVPETLKEGQAKLIKAGSDIILQMHYTANGKAGTDKSRVGFVFTNEAPKERVFMLAAAQPKFAIPPGDPNYEVKSSFQLQADAKLESFLPHMHFRGKDFEYRVTYPDGKTETLLSVPKYDFNWQLSYYLQQPKLLPKGTIIDCTAHFDNSANNKYNPDPTKEVHFGEQTWEEMMIGFFEVSFDPSVNPMDLMRPPKQQQKKASD